MPEIAKTLDQGLMLLDDVAEHGPGSVSDVAQRTGLNRTVAHRLIATLETRGSLRRNSDGLVTLGSSLLGLGEQVDTDLRSAARIPVQLLTVKMRETAVLSVPDGDEAVAIDQNGGLGSHHLVRVDYRPGMRHPLDKAAHGKAIIAFREDSTLPATEQRRIRKRGYAVSHDELQLGASGIASPVFSRDGSVVASVGIVAPVERFPDEQKAARAVLEAAAETSRALGFTKDLFRKER